MPDHAHESVSPLRLITDEFGRVLVCRGLRIAVSAARRAPFPVDAVVLEEDTHLVLSADVGIEEPMESVGQLAAQLTRVRPARPGSVVVRRGQPLELLAVVHDVDQEPIWREQWIIDALDGIFTEVERRRVRALALPLVGTRHGSIHPARVAHFISRALNRVTPGRLRRLWIRAPDRTAAGQVRGLLTARLQA